MKLDRLEAHNGPDWTVQYFRLKTVAWRQYKAACAIAGNDTVYLHRWEVGNTKLEVVNAFNQAHDCAYNIDGMVELARKAGSF
jgi:hypothetical protein